MSDLAALVARSRRLGADPSLVVHGGGNTSSKLLEGEADGRPREVLRIKGSGTDLATIGADGFPGLWLEPLRALREEPAMSDEDMVDRLAAAAVAPGSRAPSVETLLHAFLAAPHVDHTHADAICALTNHAGGREAVAEALGPDVAFVEYLRPGFALSKRVADVGGAGAAVLEHHGLVTWGETGATSYERTLALDAAARDYLARHGARHAAAVSSSSPESDRDAAPFLAGLLIALGADRPAAVLVDARQRVLADRDDVELLAAVRGTPDHMLRIGPRTAVLREPTEAGAVVRGHRAAYERYFARHRARVPAGQAMLSPLPRVYLVPGLGAIVTGADDAAARVNADLSWHSHRVTALALDAFGDSAWLTEEEIFDFEYWPLELRKLKL